MRTYRVLIAIFSLVFLLSGISLLLLIIDDQKDFSSRASLSTLNDKKPLESYSEHKIKSGISNQNWLEIEEYLYVNNLTGDTVRHLPEGTALSDIPTILGETFKSPKKIGQVKLENLTIDKFSYQLFGEVKKINFWQYSGNLFLEVGGITNSSDQTHELIQNIIAHKKQNVLGASTPDSWAKIATQVRPSVVAIYNHYCTELKFFSLPGFSLSDKIYPICLTSTGTGFFVSSDGYLATNGHIVRNLPNSSIYYALSGGKLDDLLVDFLEVYLTQKSGKTVTKQEAKNVVNTSKLSKDSLYQLGGIIVDLYQKNILKFTNESNRYFLQLGNQSAQLGQDGITQTESVIEAKLIALDYEDITKSDGFVSSDVAILKPNSGQFPALPLGTIEEAVVGSELQVIGYPSAASTALAMLDNTSTEPTFTKGLVSAIKLAKGNQKKLIQTDAIINHGNSGGPAILSSGKVVGIATYGVTVQDGSGSYNFLRDVQDLVDLAAKNNLIFDQGSLYRYWQDGLQNYYLGYYKYSTAIFESIKKTYPQHPLVDQYLKVSIEKTDTIEDKTPRLTVSTRQFLIKLSASLLVTSLIFILFFVILAKRQLKTIAQFSQTLPPAL